MNLTLPIERMRREDPDRPLLTFRERRSTRERFADRVARLGGALRELGLEPGARVGMLALNSDRYVEYFFGAWWGGFVLNPINIRWNPIEIAYSLDDCDTRTLFVDDAFVQLVPEIRERSTALRTLIYLGEGPTPPGMLAYESLVTDASPAADAMRAGEDLAAIMYTGGTTGRPKGVMLSHRAILFGQFGALASRARRSADGVAMYSTPMFHIAGLAYATQQMLMLREQVALASFVPAEFLATIERERVTETFVVPTMLRFALDDPAFAGTDLSSLEQMLYGAAPMDAALLDRALAALANVEFVHVYGMTELVGAVTQLPGRYNESHDGVRAKAGSAGQPIPTAEIRIVDPEGDEVAVGAVGEIVVRGPVVMSGYWNRPEETAAALRDGWLFTGDGGRMDEDGFVYVVDRIKDMIISGGENIFSAEVESAISLLPGVSMCGVVGVPDERWGERVHAIVVPAPGAVLDAESIIAHCRARIAGFKCPRTVEFRDALPLSPVGKVLKYQLRAEVRERAVATTAPPSR